MIGTRANNKVVVWLLNTAVSALLIATLAAFACGWFDVPYRDAFRALLSIYAVTKLASLDAIMSNELSK